MNESRLDIVINAKDKSKTAFKSVDKNMTSLTGSAKKLGGALVGLFAFKKVADFAWSAVEAFGAQEASEAKLAEIMMRVNSATEEQIKQMHNQAKALQRTTVVGDEVVMSLQAQLGTFALSAEAVMALTENTLDLAVANKGVNLTTEDMINYGNLVGKVMAGQVGALSRYGVSLTETQAEQLKLGNEMERATILSEILQGNYGDLAKAMKNTTQGRLRTFKNAWGDLKEVIGEQLIPALNVVLDWAVKTGIPKIIEAGSWLKERWKSNFLGIRTVITGSVRVIKTVINDWIEAIQLLVNAWDRATSALTNYKRKALSIGAGSTAEFQAINPAPDIEKIKRDAELAKVQAEAQNLAGELAIGGGAVSAGGGGTAKENPLIAELKSRLEDLVSIRQRHRDSILDSKKAVEELNEKYREEINTSKEAIKGLEQSLLDLQSAFESDKSAFGKKRIEEIVKQEEKIASLKEQIKDLSESSTGTDRAQELENQLSQEESALEKYREFINKNETAIQEVRDFNALTSFEQSMIKIDSELEAKTAQFEKEKELLEQKLRAERENLQKIKEAHKSALDEMELQRQKDLVNYKNYLALRVSAYKRAQSEMGGLGGAGETPLPQFAKGGIANSPVIAGEGRLPEAIVPLPDGKTIPVEVKGGANNNITINIESPDFRDEASADNVIQKIVRALEQANLGVA